MKNLIIENVSYDGDFSIKHTQYGFDELEFTVYSGEEAFSKVYEEQTVKYHDQLYTIKSISDNGRYAQVSCELDLSCFEENIIQEIGTKDTPQTLTITQVLSNFIPKGWSYVVKDTGITAEWKSSLVTFKDVLKSASKAYNVHYDFGFTQKQIDVQFINESNYKGNYITEQLNIVSLSHQGDTYDLCTRLFYYGKDDKNNLIPIDNGGKPYVEDFTYTNKIIAKAMTDDTTTDKRILLENAKKTLQTLNKPSSSFTFQISRLTEGDYALPHLKINELVKYLDRRNKREIMHRIVEYEEHPNNILDDRITLSTTATTIEDEVTQISNSISSNANVVATEASKDALNIVKNYTGTGHARFDQNRILILNNLPIENATGLFMIDKFGFWWNNHFAEHVLTPEGTIQSTTWTKLIDINTGALWQK